MKKKLTDRFVESVKPPTSGRIEIGDTSAPGLTLRVASGKGPGTAIKSWSIRYRPKGHAQRRETLGAYLCLLSGGKADVKRSYPLCPLIARS